jgi:Tfp pilus assembly protein FimT
MKRATHGSRACTLIELLVVISIIALLVSLLHPGGLRCVAGPLLRVERCHVR